jgi:hypothetical protein
MSKLYVNQIVEANSGYGVQIPSKIYANQIVEANVGNGVQIPGHVVQVVTSESTNNSGAISSTTYVAASGLTASITPSSTSSKILVLVNSSVYGTSAATEGAYTIYRNGSDIGDADGLSRSYTGASDHIVPMSMHILDSPASSSSVTYAVYVKRTQGSGSLYTNLRGGKQSVTLMEIAQ